MELALQSIPINQRVSQMIRTALGAARSLPVKMRDLGLARLFITSLQYFASSKARRHTRQG